MRMSAWSRIRPCDRNSTDELGCPQILFASTASSVGEAAQGGFELAGDGAALAQDPGQAEQRQEQARPGSWLVDGEGGQVGSLADGAAQGAAEPGRPQGVADLDPAPARGVAARGGMMVSDHLLHIGQSPAASGQINREQLLLTTHADPVIQEPTDAIVRITSSGICG